MSFLIRGFKYEVNDGQMDSNLATVFITVTAVNDAPTLANQALTTAQDTAVTGNLLASAADVDSTALNAAIVAGPQHGSLTVNANGTFSYKAVANYFGTDSFTYTVNDGALTSNIATVSLTITQAPSTTASADLGLAGQFNAFVFNDFTSSNCDTQGALAVGHNLHVSSYSVNDQHRPVLGYSAVVGGDLYYVGGGFNGTISVGGNQTVAQNGAGDVVQHQASPIDFAKEQARLTALSTGLSTLPAKTGQAVQRGAVTSSRALG